MEHNRNLELYVIKSGGMYLFLHSDMQDVSFEFNDLKGAMKFTKKEVQYIHDNFKELWYQDKFEVYELQMNEVRNFKWHK